MESTSVAEERMPHELSALRQRIAVLEASEHRLKGTEEALGYRERYRDLYEHTPVMMHSIDSEGRLVSVNDYWLEALGHERSEVIGRRSTEFLTEASSRYAIEVALPEFFKTGLARDVEYQMVKKNGEVMDVLLSAVSQRDQSGEIEYTRASMVDVTEWKHSEETRRQRTIAEERNRLAREIHDTLAQSLLSIIIRLEASLDLVRQDPDSARREIQSVRELAREALEEARRSVWELQSPALASGSLTNSVQQEIARTSEEDIQVSLDVRGEEPGSMDQRNGLAVLRIVQEALGNVRRHAHAKKAVVQLDYDSSSVRLQVSDDGVGFEPSAAPGMLSPTGGQFGLASMRERARLAGGEIALCSAPDMGTKVEARIPYQADEEQAPIQEQAPTTPNPGQEPGAGVIRVLIVDDHEVVRRGFRNMLEQADGVRVVGEAGDGNEAIEKIQKTDPDVVLMDIRMPKLDGVETLRRLSELGEETPIILLSAYARDEYIFEGLRAGARGYLLKDVARDDLVRAVRSVHRGGLQLQPAVADRLIERLEGADSSPLTVREQEVIGLLATGARNKEIADHLSLTVRTVRFHVENIYRKLGVQSRTQAVRVGREEGLLDS